MNTSHSHSENPFQKNGTQAALMEIDPEFGAMAIRMGAEVWSRPGLTTRERAFLSIAANVCNQSLDGPLQMHIDMALASGATPREVREVLLHMTLYASFPKTLAAMRALHEHLSRKELSL